MEKIILTGYMASGKSTVGRLLSNSLDLEFIDLDDLVQSEAQMPIPDIFAKLGEIRFRKLEHGVLKNLIGSPNTFVLALGGGTPCYSNNHLMLRAQGVTSFYLRAGVQALAGRLASDRLERPIIAGIDDEDLPNFIGTHLFERDPFYRNAHHIINTDGLAPRQIAESIMDQLRRA